MIAHIVCGSPSLWLPKHLTGYVVGVDRGALKLIERSLDFDVAIGDFDSVSTLERRLIEEKAKFVLELPIDKDITDCEAAVENAVDNGYRQIYLYGATGGRFDHQFATIGLMLKYAKRGVQLYLVDEKNRIEILLPFSHHTIEIKKKYISFFAIENTVKNLTIQDVKYPLDGYDLIVDDSLCVSNEALHPMVKVNFDSGYLLVVQSSD